MDFDMDLEEVKSLLGVTNQDTVDNWLCQRHNPWAKLIGLEWKFDREAVLDVKSRLDELRRKNEVGDFSFPDWAEDD